MNLRAPRVRALTVAVAAALAASAGTAAASTAGQAPVRPAATIPAQVYAPYFETYLPGNLASIARQSGARYLTLAFLQAPEKGSCTAAWNGQQPLASGRYLSQIAALRRMGGDVIPSFGGFSADNGGTEIADSCTSVSKIAAVYELLVRKYHVTRLDMDVEAKSLNNAAGIDRRNKAIAMAQAWAAARGRTLQVDFTIPVEPYGLDPNGLHVLQNAVANGVHVDVVNIMTFDYYQTHEGHVDMAAAAMSAAENLHNQLVSVYPKASAGQLWRMEGMTLLPGVDDRGRIETTYVSSAAQILAFAQHEHMSLLSIWALQRDNGGCPGSVDSNTCSGIRQRPWAFSHLLEPFTAGTSSSRQHLSPVYDYVTFFGYVDNSPPGRSIAHPCIHQKAGGAGTYSNPVTYAQVGASGPWCQLIYVPFLKKYFIHEDQCGGSCGGVPDNHVDLWMGGDAASLYNPEKHALLACENQWTRHATVILNPPSNEPVDPVAMFTPPTTCHGGQGD